MRTMLLSLAAAGTALVFASPAAAQYYPQQNYGQNYGYNQNYGYGGQQYGYRNNNYGDVRSLQYRIDAVERQINQLDRRNYVRDGSADRLRGEAHAIERRLHQAQRFGLNPYEANDIQVRIARLEQRVQYAVGNRYGRYGQSGYGYNGQYDRDNDRDNERDRDRDYDGDRPHN